MKDNRWTVWNMISKLREVPVGVKASVSYVLASFLSSGIAYLTTPLYTRLLTDVEYGRTSLFLTWFNIFGIIAMFRLDAGVFNNGMVDYPEKRDEYSFSMLILSNIITIAFSIVFLPLFSFSKQIDGLDMPTAVLMCMLFLFQPAYTFWNTRHRYEYKYKKPLLFSLIATIVPTAITIILLLFTSINRVYSRLFGYYGTLVLFYIVFYVHTGVKNQWRINTSYWKHALKFNLPLIPHYLSLYILSSSDKIMISKYVGEASTAYYSVAYTIAAIALTVWSAINGSLIPYTYEKCKQKEYGSINQVAMPMLFFFLLVCGGIVLVAPEALSILAPAEYSDALSVVPPVIGGVFFQVQYSLFANVLYYYKRPKYVMFGSIISASLNLLLNYIFIPKYGYQAAGYTTLICYIIQATLDYIGMKIAIKETIYDIKAIILLSVTVIVISLIAVSTYPYPVIRYVLIFIIFLGLFFSRKRFFLLYRHLKG